MIFDRKLIESFVKYYRVDRTHISRDSVSENQTAFRVG